MHAGFMEAVQGANATEMGQRNGGAMLSAQGTERGLLQHLLARLRALDPDVLVGHNISAFDLDVLLHRLQHHKVVRAPSLGHSSISEQIYYLKGWLGNHNPLSGVPVFWNGFPLQSQSLTLALVTDIWVGCRLVIMHVVFVVVVMGSGHLAGYCVHLRETTNVSRSRSHTICKALACP